MCIDEPLAVLLSQHKRRYPEMRAKDMAKLVYQNEFGCGHLVDDLVRCQAMLQEEYAACPIGAELFEDIGNGYARLYLGNAREAGYPPDTLAALFFESAKRQDGNASRFLEKLRMLTRFYPASEVEALCAEAVHEAYAPFSHTQAYRLAYHPAYRVVLSLYQPLLELIRAVAIAPKPVVVGIDGRCGAGKTTLAARLQALFDAAVVHMDDFFLPLDLRTPERLSQPGGNTHYERFTDEVAPKLRDSQGFEYGIFDCSQGRINGYRTVPASEVRIVEGSYALHPHNAKLYDIRVFVDVDPQLQRERLLLREGQEALLRFETRWIPMEERYIQAYAIQNSCDYTVRSAN